mmetsp:Transcript_58156/g.123507  ORF Transcript_58156/g.123507 Transcript_58156/m.123507 type:complete len:286 (-) Transcript_58156:2400-3257(-)
MLQEGCAAGAVAASCLECLLQVGGQDGLRPPSASHRLLHCIFRVRRLQVGPTHIVAALLFQLFQVLGCRLTQCLQLPRSILGLLHRQCGTAFCLPNAALSLLDKVAASLRGSALLLLSSRLGCHSDFLVVKIGTSCLFQSTLGDCPGFASLLCCSLSCDDSLMLLFLRCASLALRFHGHLDGLGKLLLHVAESCVVMLFLPDDLHRSNLGVRLALVNEPLSLCLRIALHLQAARLHLQQHLLTLRLHSLAVPFSLCCSFAPMQNKFLSIVPGCLLSILLLFVLPL